MARVCAVSFCVLLLIAGSQIARATPFSTLGVGGRAMAMASAMTVASDDFGAAYYNPACYARVEAISVTAGYYYLKSNLKINGSSFEMDDMDISGVFAGFAVPFQVVKRRVGIGVALQLPDSGTIRARMVPAQQPRFVLINNELQRADIYVGVGAEVLPRFMIGAGVGILADLKGQGIRIDANLQGDPTASADVEIRLNGAPQGGIVWEPTESLRLGMAYRGRLKIDLQIPTSANLHLQTPLDFLAIDATIEVASRIFYQPQQIALGCAFDILDDITVALDGTWVNWGNYTYPSPNVNLRIGGTLGGILAKPPNPYVPAADFEDTWNPRIGAEYRWKPEGNFSFSFRGGYGFEPTPVKEQTGFSNYLDSDKHVVAAGLGISYFNHDGTLYGPVNLDIYYQYHMYGTREHKKTDPTDPIGDIRHSGTRFSLGASLTLRF